MLQLLILKSFKFHFILRCKIFINVNYIFIEFYYKKYKVGAIGIDTADKTCIIQHIFSRLNIIIKIKYVFEIEMAQIITRFTAR